MVLPDDHYFRLPCSGKLWPYKDTETYFQTEKTGHSHINKLALYNIVFANYFVTFIFKYFLNSIEINQ